MRIRRTHELGVDEAKSRVERVAADLGQSLSLNSSWNGDNLEFRGNGVNGQIAVEAETIEVQVKLGLALLMMEGSIRSAIEATLDKQLG